MGIMNPSANEQWREHSMLHGLPLCDELVCLRAPRAEDAQAVFAYAQEPDQAETIWLPLPFQCSRAAAERFIVEVSQGWAGRQGLGIVIADPVSDQLFGILLLSQHAGREEAEVVYGVAPVYRNRGVATRALSLLAPWAFMELQLSRLELRIGRNHLMSQRVAEKAGFVREGVVWMPVHATGEEYEDIVYALVPKQAG
jgi:RimJ/RimL family protein N-acetyltransferase